MYLGQNWFFNLSSIKAFSSNLMQVLRVCILEQALITAVNSLQVLYMDAVQHIPDDIQDIVDLMTEKEIRLHAPLEEIELLLQE